MRSIEERQPWQHLQSLRGCASIGHQCRTERSLKLSIMFSTAVMDLLGTLPMYKVHNRGAGQDAQIQ